LALVLFLENKKMHPKTPTGCQKLIFAGPFLFRRKNCGDAAVIFSSSLNVAVLGV
jgi:hypothetical protein